MNLRPYLPHLALLICVILFSFAVKTFASTSIESSGVYDGGNRVYSAANPPPATDTSGLVPKDAWWGSTYHGSNGDIYLGYWGIWLSTELSNLTNGYASSAGTASYASSATAHQNSCYWLQIGNGTSICSSGYYVAGISACWSEYYMSCQYIYCCVL